MEYTNTEKQFLELLDRTNFKNLSKNDVITYASKLNELRPEVATQVIAQYPEFMGLMQSSLSEYRGMIEKLIESDDSSINYVYDIAEKNLDNANKGRNLFYDCANKVLSDCGKILDNPTLTAEEQREIREQEMEILRMVDNKDKEIRDKEMDTLRTVDKKDSEKRAFNWKTITAVSTVLIVVAGVSGAMLGGNFNFKLPKK